jgi:hypothetical protein
MHLEVASGCYQICTLKAASASSRALSHPPRQRDAETSSQLANPLSKPEINLGIHCDVIRKRIFGFTATMLTPESWTACLEQLFQLGPPETRWGRSAPPEGR